MKKIKFIGYVFGMLLLANGICQAEDLAVKQNRAFYNYCYAYYDQNISEFEINDKALQRYGLWLIQENNRPEKSEWLTRQVWLYKLADWKDKRLSSGQYVPREAVIGYLAMMLGEERMDIFSGQQLVGQRHGYADSGFLPIRAELAQ